MSIIYKFCVFIIYLLVLSKALSFAIPNSLNVDYIDDIDNFTFRITGGYRPQHSSLAKYIVSLRLEPQRKFFGDNHFCGGSIISPKVIITAAHCLMKGPKVKIRPIHLIVVAGSTNRFKRTDQTRIHKVRKTIIHPSYRGLSLNHDIGLIKLKSAIIFNDNAVGIIKLVYTRPPPGTTCTCLGWGRLIFNGPVPAELTYVNTTIWSNEDCKKRFKELNSGMVCCGDNTDFEKDSCSGDSGGPLISAGKLTGIVSFGVGCGSPYYPGVYTDVAFYRSWIEKNTAVKIEVHNFPRILFMAYLLVFFHWI